MNVTRSTQLLPVVSIIITHLLLASSYSSESPGQQNLQISGIYKHRVEIPAPAETVAELPPASVELGLHPLAVN